MATLWLMKFNNCLKHRHMANVGCMNTRKYGMNNVIVKLMLVVGLMCCLPGMHAEEKTYTATFDKAYFPLGTEEETIDGVTWKTGTTESYGLIGSYSNPNFTFLINDGWGTNASNFSLGTSDIPGTILSVTVNCGYAKKDFDSSCAVSVGGTEYGSQQIPSSISDISFTGSSTGEIMVAMNCESFEKPMCLNAITVTYEVASETQAEAPEISLASGFYTGVRQVSINNIMEGGTAYYTIDNGEAQQYQGTPVTLDASCVFRAWVEAPGYSPSEKVYANYLIEIPGEGEAVFEFGPISLESNEIYTVNGVVYAITNHVILEDHFSASRSRVVVCSSTAPEKMYIGPTEYTASSTTDFATVYTASAPGTLQLDIPRTVTDIDNLLVYYTRPTVTSQADLVVGQESVMDGNWWVYRRYGDDVLLHDGVTEGGQFVRMITEDATIQVGDVFAPGWTGVLEQPERREVVRALSSPEKLTGVTAPTPEIPKITIGENSVSELSRYSQGQIVELQDVMVGYPTPAEQYLLYEVSLYGTPLQFMNRYVTDVMQPGIYNVTVVVGPTRATTGNGVRTTQNAINTVYYPISYSDNDGPTTGAAEIETAPSAEPVYYNLQGLQVTQPMRGRLYIRITGTHAEKVVY